MPLHTRILIGLVVGTLLGAGVNAAFPADHVVHMGLTRYVAHPLGQVFLRLMFMVVMPLVFCSVVLGVAGIGDLRKVGRLGARTLAFFIVSSLAAGALGILAVGVVRPGEAIAADVRAQLLQAFATEAGAKVGAAQAGGFGIDTFINIVSRNPLKSAVDGDMLGVIFFALMFGAALTMITKARAEPLVHVLEAINDVIVKIVELAMTLAPVGVAALIFGVTSRFGFALLRPLGLYVGLVLFALLLHAAVLLVVVVRLGAGLSPRVFLSRARGALVTAFSTSSSSATLPTNITVAEDRLGIPPRIAGFVLPLGATMCMNGTALFEGITVLFLCQVFHVDLSVGQMVIVLMMTVVTAIGAAGVPGGSIPLLVGILVLLGVPGEGIAIVLGVDRVLDMARTAVNVLGDLSCVTFLAKHEGAWDPSSLPREDGSALDESPGWPKPGDVKPRA